MSGFSQTLRKLRKEKGISQEELSRFIKVTRLTISNYEQGRREPDFHTLCLFADFYGCSVDYLLGRSSVKNITEAERISKYMPEIEDKLHRLSSDEREFLILLLNDGLKNLESLLCLPEYRNQQFFSTIAINLLANKFSLLMDSIFKTIFTDEGKLNNFNVQNISEKIQGLADESYDIKIDMFKTIDVMQNIFIKELASIAKRAGLPYDIQPDSKTLTSNTKNNLEKIFQWKQEP